MYSTKRLALLAMTTVPLLLCAMPQALAADIKNVVMVHGAWADGSGWRPIYEILKGRVTMFAWCRTP